MEFKVVGENNTDVIYQEKLNDRLLRPLRPRHAVLLYIALLQSHNYLVAATKMKNNPLIGFEVDSIKSNNS